MTSKPKQSSLSIQPIDFFLLSKLPSLRWVTSEEGCLAAPSVSTRACLVEMPDPLSLQDSERESEHKGCRMLEEGDQQSLFTVLSANGG